MITDGCFFDVAEAGSLAARIERRWRAGHGVTYRAWYGGMKGTDFATYNDALVSLLIKAAELSATERQNATRCDLMLKIGDAVRAALGEDPK